MSGGPALGEALSREAIASGGLQRLVEASGAEVWSDEQRDGSLAATLAARPGGPWRAPDDVWLFAYGSLIWNPTVRFVERRVGTVAGWHRRFCLSVKGGRGTQDAPGLVLGLDRGGSCRGVAFRIAGETVREELDLVWRREMVTGAYEPRWCRLRGRTEEVPVIGFVVNRAGPGYAPPAPQAEVAAQIAGAEGFLGPNADYLLSTVQGLDEVGIPDPALSELAVLVRRLRDG